MQLQKLKILLKEFKITIMPIFLRQRVNQWLCIALLGLMCFWTVLYYLTNKAEAIGNNFSANLNIDK